MRARSSLRAECLPVRISASNRSRSSALRVTTYLLTAACLADTESIPTLTRGPSIRGNQALSMTRGTRSDPRVIAGQLRGRDERCRSGGWTLKCLRDSDSACDLAIALPVGLLHGDRGVIHCWLDVAGRIDRPRRDGVLPWRGRPVEMPGSPCEVRLGVFEDCLRP